MRLWRQILSSVNRYFNLGWALIKRDMLFVYDGAGLRSAYQWETDQVEFFYEHIYNTKENFQNYFYLALVIYSCN
jgi:hypothetical protein